MSEDYIYYSDACLVFIVTGLICGIVRLLHHCRPYGNDAEYFYPASRLVSFLFMGTVLLTPYYLCPSDPGIWLYAKVFDVIYFPAAFTALFLRYFRRQRLASAEAAVFLFTPIALLLALMAAVAIPAANAWTATHGKAVIGVAAACGIVQMAYLCKILVWLKRQIDRFNKDNYADDSDFPHKFAGRVVYMPLVWLALTWLVLLADSRAAKLCLDLVLSAWTVAGLCLILHPQRTLRVEGAEIGEKPAPENPESPEISGCSENPEYSGPADSAADNAADDDARRQVLETILRKYREQHIQKSDILAEIDSGKKSGANRFITQVGYYNLINMFRLEHARLYAQAHPEAKQSEIALAAGFASGSSFSKAKRSVPRIDPGIVSGVSI